MIEAKKTAPKAVRLHRIYQKLAMSLSLAPSTEIDTLFAELVAMAVDTRGAEARALMEDPLVRALQQRLWSVCAHGEVELERYWAEAIIASVDPHEQLRRFPYLDNYRKLTRLEVSALSTVLEPRGAHALFIGCGPLPLTSIELAMAHGVRVHNIDIEERAVRLARALVARLALPVPLAIERRGLADLTDLSAYDLVVLAALVGRDRREKRRMLGHLHGHMRPGALLLVRSAHSVRALLYPIIDSTELAPFLPLLELHPHDEVINSVLIARRDRPRGLC